MTIDELPTLGTVRNPIEWRAAEMIDVQYADRVVTVLAMPYEQPTDKVVRGGRQITEVVSTGAFGQNIEHRKDVRAYRGHNKDATVGRVIGLHPDDPRGLITEVRMAKTPLGDETLALAADQLIDASVGFAPIEQRWSADRSERRILRAYLDHLAFVGDPAYPGAVVLDVRAAADLELVTDPPAVGSTPNKDAVLARLRAVGYPPAL